MPVPYYHHPPGLPHLPEFSPLPSPVYSTHSSTTSDVSEWWLSMNGADHTYASSPTRTEQRARLLPSRPSSRSSSSSASSETRSALDASDSSMPLRSRSNIRDIFDISPAHHQSSIYNGYIRLSPTPFQAGPLSPITELGTISPTTQDFGEHQALLRNTTRGRPNIITNDFVNVLPSIANWDRDRQGEFDWEVDHEIIDKIENSLESVLMIQTAQELGCFSQRVVDDVVVLLDELWRVSEDHLSRLEPEQKQVFESCMSILSALDVYHRDYYLEEYKYKPSELASKAGSSGDTALSDTLALRLAWTHLIMSNQSVGIEYYRRGSGIDSRVIGDDRGSD